MHSIEAYIQLVCHCWYASWLGIIYKQIGISARKVFQKALIVSRSFHRIERTNQKVRNQAILDRNKDLLDIGATGKKLLGGHPPDLHGTHPA